MADDNAKNTSAVGPAPNVDAAQSAGAENGSTPPSKQKRNVKTFIILLLKTVALVLMALSTTMNTAHLRMGNRKCYQWRLRRPYRPPNPLEDSEICRFFVKGRVLIFIVATLSALTMVLGAISLALEVIKVIKMKSIGSYALDAIFLYYIGILGIEVEAHKLFYGVSMSLMDKKGAKAILASHSISSGVLGLIASFIYFAISYLECWGVGKLEADREVRRIAPGVQIVAGSPSMMGIPPKGQGKEATGSKGQGQGQSSVTPQP